MVHKITTSKYKPFIETLVITILILCIGFFLGFFVESYRTGKIVESYKNFEVGALDLKLQNYYYQIMDSASCEKAIEQNFVFADKIYEKGLLIERYEESTDLTEELLLEKKKYVLLKTELWLNSMLLKEKCDKPFHTVVYLYSQEGNIAKKAEQEAIADTLKQLKEKYQNEIILLPIAGNLGLEVVDLQMRVYDVEYLPSIIINEEHVLEGFQELEEFESYLGDLGGKKPGVLYLN